jgi:hypothetical protein
MIRILSFMHFQKQRIFDYLKLFVIEIRRKLDITQNKQTVIILLSGLLLVAKQT